MEEVGIKTPKLAVASIFIMVKDVNLNRLALIVLALARVLIKLMVIIFARSGVLTPCPALIQPKVKLLVEPMVFVIISILPTLNANARIFIQVIFVRFYHLAILIINAIKQQEHHSVRTSCKV